MVNQVNAKQTQFRAEPYTINYNNKRQTPPMPEELLAPQMDDVFMMQEMQNKNARKKEKNKERWYKTGVCAQVGLAVAFSVMAGATIYNIIKQGKGGDIAKNFKFEDFSKKDNFPSLSDDCVNPKVRKFIEGFKKKAGLKSAVKEKLGISKDEQCLLMYGPSGTGKTFSAKLLAKELGAEYGEVQFADVSSPYVGQTSVKIKKVFEKIAEKAKKNPDKKFVTAFNEIDALLVPREKCGSNNLHLAENRTAFLNGLDLIRDLKNVKIVGTTNVHPDSGNLDKASLSRFANMLEIELPTEKELIASLKFHLRNCKIVEEQKFFESHKSEIEKFAKELHAKKYSQRDVEDIAVKAIDKAAYAMNESKNLEAEKFSVKYLKEAVTDKGMTTGEIGAKVVPAWQKQSEAPQFKYKTKTVAKNLWESIKNYFSSKEAA